MLDRTAAFAFLVVVAASALHEMEHNEELALLPSRYLPRHRLPSKRRNRTKFEAKNAHLSDNDFKRAFCLSRPALQKLVMLLLPFLARNELQARRSSGGAVEPAIRLGVTLRMLAGGMHHAK